MHTVVGAMRPGIHFNEELSEFHLGQAGGDEVFKGFGAGRPLVCFQRRENAFVVLDTDLTVFARQMLLDLDQTGFAFRLTLDQTLQALAWGPGLTNHFKAAGWPLRRW